MDIIIFCETFAGNAYREVEIMIDGHLVETQAGTMNNKDNRTVKIIDYLSDFIKITGFNRGGEDFILHLWLSGNKIQGISKHQYVFSKTDQHIQLQVDVLELKNKYISIIKKNRRKDKASSSPKRKEDKIHLDDKYKTDKKNGQSAALKPILKKPGFTKIDYDRYNQASPETLLTKKIKIQENTVVEVFYATDRKINEGDKKNIYGESRGTIKLGMCKVNIPKLRKKGELPRPKWYKLEFRESPEKHMFILETEELAPQIFFLRLSERLDKSEDGDVFVFIHGYNVNFQDSVLRTAQITKDIGFTGAPIVYSWPSKAATLSYLSDEDNVQFTSDNIILFLKDIKKITSAKKIHLLAHSMGNRALTKALIDLRSEDFFSGFQFNQIILAAPDIDAQYFVKSIAPKLINLSKRTTLYTSEKDMALKTSKILHGNINRTGFSSENIVVCEGIDTVDASKVDTDKLGHGYFASTAPLINDIYQITKHNHSPDERNLTAIVSDKNIYWEFEE